MIINTLDQLKEFTKEIVKKVPEFNFFGLKGELGAGKTQFTKFFVKELGGNIEEVVSPTFTICNEYQTPYFKIYHFDLYRLNSIDELEEIGYKDFFYSDNIVIVEWIDNIIESIPKKNILIEFNVIDENNRECIVIENFSL